ncbi:InlB B-repeat-containing protein [bacterium]|nr:InlB B-repeat-containing protein [bacterium]
MKLRVKNILLLICGFLFFCSGVFGDMMPAGAIPGTLDESFGSLGRTYTDLNQFSAEYGKAVVCNSEGKVIVAATVNGTIALARFDSTGVLDPAFGDAGIVITPITGEAKALNLLSAEGEYYIVVGSTDDGGENDFVVACYDYLGAPETNFGNGGVVTTDFGGTDDSACAVGISYDDGGILVAGYTNVNGNYDFAVAKYTFPFGNLDTSFNITGKSTFDINDSGYDDKAFGITINAIDYSILVTGSAGNGTDSDLALICLDTSGDLDSDFDSDGILTCDFNSNNDDIGYAVSYNSTNTCIVVTGTTDNGTDLDFAIAVIDSDGVHLVTKDLGDDEQGNGVAFQTDGKIIVSGTAGSDFAVIRYQADIDNGLDTTFNDPDGYLIADIAGFDDTANGMSLDIFDRIVIVGTSIVYGNPDLVVTRITADGSPDYDFGSGSSYQAVDFPLVHQNDCAFGVAVQYDGKIVVSGSNGSSAGLVRYNSNGSLDTSFGSNGTVKVTIPGYTWTANEKVVIQPDHKIILVGSTEEVGGPLVISRFNEDGSPDIGFGINGRVEQDPGVPVYIAGVGLQSDGKIVVGTTASDDGDYFVLVIRLNTDGSLDETFGDGGMAYDENGMSYSAMVYDMVIQPDDKIVLSGGIINGIVPNFFLVRFTAGGVLDTTFGSNEDGKVIITPGPFATIANGVALQPDGKIVAAGLMDTTQGMCKIAQVPRAPRAPRTPRAPNAAKAAKAAENFLNIVIMRFLSDGTLDETFADEGINVLDTGEDIFIEDVLIDTNGKIVVGGNYNGWDFAVGCFNSNGSICSEFGDSYVTGFTFPDLSTGGDFVDDCTAIALDSNHRIIAVGFSDQGTTYTDFTIARINSTPLTVKFTTTGHGEVLADSTQYVVYNGVTTSVSPDPDYGYHFSGWTGDHTGSETDFPLILTNVIQDMNIVAHFSKNTFTVDFTIMGNGSITGTLSQNVEFEGSTTPVTAVADPGNHFTGWTGDVTTITNPLTITNVDNNMVVTANFNDACTVMNTDDSGTGSLRQAILTANSGETILFDAGVMGTITLTSGQLAINKKLTIHGPGIDDLTISGNNTSRIFFIGPNGDVTINLMTITNGNAGINAGGGIWSQGKLTLSACVVSGNTTDNNFGAGICNSDGDLMVENCTISSNNAGTTSGYGGGIYVRSGSALITNSTISGNSAYKGGALYNTAFNDTSASVSTIEVYNSTLSGNTVSCQGGALFNWAHDNVNAHAKTLFNNCTITENSATVEGGGVYVNDYTGDDQLCEVMLKNTILAGNTAPTGADCLNSPQATCTTQSLGYCLVGATVDFTGGTGDINIGADDPLLAPLADNGGPTFTHALESGCLAVNAGAGTDSEGNPVPNDQRGVARPQGASNDIGAVEAAVHTVTFVAGPNGHIDGTLVQQVIDGGSTTSVTAVPDENYLFSDWTGDGLYKTSNPLAVTDVTSDMNITANFVSNTLTVTNDYDDGAGSLRNTIAIAPPGAVIMFDSGLAGQVITLTTDELVINKNLTINGTAAPNLSINVYEPIRIFKVISGVSATITGLTINGGYLEGGFGAGILNEGSLILSDCTVKDCTNINGFGGGICNRGDLVVQKCTISGNNVGNGDGGGIFNEHLGNLTVNFSTICGNSAQRGGGIMNWETNIESSAITTINNSTISGNNASSYGGGIMNYSDCQDANAHVAINFATITDNSAGSIGGGLYQDWGVQGTKTAEIEYRDTIIAGNNGEAGPNDCAQSNGTMISRGYCLIGETTGDVTGDATDIVIGTADPNLGPLDDNGGPTKTHKPLSGCLAINAGNSQGIGGTEFTVDQRFFARPQGAAHDIGAVEAELHTVTFVAGPNGHITGTLVQYVSDGGSTTPVTAIPDEFYVFSNWSGDDFYKTNNPLVVTNVLSDMIITADFAYGIYTVTNDMDDGCGSLRHAITYVPPNGYIVFDSSLANHVITLTTGQLFITQNLIIDGSAAPNLEISGNNTSRVFKVDTGVTVAISGLIISNGNSSGSYGAGIYNQGSLTLTNCEIKNCTAPSEGYGAGIANSGVLVVQKSSIHDNSLPSGTGGGIFNSPPGIVTICSSTIANNSAYQGAGIMNLDTTLSAGSVVVINNSTISGNVASDKGGGIMNYSEYNGSDARVTINFATITNNSAAIAGGGICQEWGSSGTKIALTQYRNTIIAGNTVEVSPNDCALINGTMISMGYCLIGVTSGSPTGDATDIVIGTASPNLGPLEDNGGPTKTHKLLQGCPAIDAGNSEGIGGVVLTVDQRNYYRPQGGGYDIGAYEASAGEITADYTIIFNAATGGTISGTTPQIIPPGGTTTPVTAVPGAGYLFSGWTGDYTGTENPLTIADVSTNMTITAQFVQNNAPVLLVDRTPVMTPIAQGAVNNPGNTVAQIVVDGSITDVEGAVEAIAVTSVDNRNGRWEYSLDDGSTWNNFSAAIGTIASFANLARLLDGVAISSTTNKIRFVPNTNYTGTTWFLFRAWDKSAGTVGQTGNASVTGGSTPFSAQRDTAYVKVGTQYTVTFTSGPHGHLTGTTTQTVISGGSCTPVTAVTESGYQFAGWTGDYTGSNNPLTVTNVTQNMTITANFETALHAVTFTTDGHGTIQGVTPQGIPHGGDCSPVTAVPASGYHFIGWTGSITSPNNPITVQQVTEDMTITAVFSNTWVVHFSAGAHGKLSGETAQLVVQGQGTSSVTAIPDAGYHFTGWTGDVTSSSNPLSVSGVSSNISVTANFSNTYTVSFSSGGNGKIEGSTSQEVISGQSCTMVTAVPDTGYQFLGWTGDFEGTGNPLLIANVSKDMSITALFGLPSFTVTFSAGSNGSLTGNTTQTVGKGESCTEVTALPADGYEFTGWSGDYTGKDNPLVLSNVTRDMTITANFALPVYTVSFSAGANGSLTGNTTQTVGKGENCTEVTAVPAEGYEFTGWSGDYTGKDNPLALSNITRDMTITANFALPVYTVSFSEGANGSITGNTTQTVKKGESSTEVTAVPAEGYDFIGWTGDYTGAANPLTLSNVTSDMTITANFGQPVYTVSFSAGANGSLTGQTAQTVKKGGSCTEVTAIPAEGYDFIGWSGDFTGAANPLIISNVTSDMTITANFGHSAYTVTFSSGSNGSLSGQTSQTVIKGGSCSAVTAVPANGYRFTGWTGDYTGSDNPLTLSNVTSDMTVFANFSNVWTVTFSSSGGGTLTGNTTQTVTNGSNCSMVTAVPSNGYRFTGWSGSYNGTDNPLTISNVTSDLTITANFSNTWSVTFSTNGFGSISGSTSQTVTNGSNCSEVSAIPGTGYYFAGWSGDYTGAANPLTITNVMSDLTITANFVLIPVVEIPSIAGFSPGSGGPGTWVTISGSNFKGVTDVSFGGTQAASFVVDSDTQITAQVGSGSTGTISVTTAGGTASSTGIFSMNVNEAPTDISLSSTSVDENKDAGTEVGTFSTTDVNSADIHTYSFVNGEGDTDNGSFSISGSSLVTTSKLDYETQNTYSIRVRSTDNGNPGLSCDRSFVITVNNTNDPPVIGELAGGTVREGEQFTLQVSAVDVEGDAITYSLNEAPEGMTISETGGISWTPDFTMAGDYTVTVQATDSKGSSSEASFSLKVLEGGTAPVITTTELPNAQKGIPYSAQITVEDPDVGDSFAFELLSGPGWMSINDATGELSGTPSQSDIADSVTVSVGVTDSGGLKADKTFTITVENVNNPPSLTNESLPDARQNELYTALLAATDPDEGDTLTFIMPGGPGWMTLNSETGELSGTPGNGDAADSVLVTVGVRDSGGLTEEKTFMIKVVNVNDPPRITTASLPDATEGQEYSAGIAADDPDQGDTLAFSLVQGPGWLAINSETGALSGIPGSDDIADSVTVTIEVKDAQGLTDNREFMFTVINVNDPPEIVTEKLPDGFEDLPYEAKVDILDPDRNDTHLFELVSAPKWLEIDPTGGGLSGKPGTFDVAEEVTIIIRVTDEGGLFAEKTFMIPVKPSPLPKIEVLSPNGGEKIMAGGSFDIAWIAKNLAAVMIEYTTNEGASWEKIVDSIAADENYTTWTLPQIQSTLCRIRISNPENNLVFDVSDTTFTIYRPPVLTVDDILGTQSGNVSIGVLSSDAGSDSTGLIVSYVIDNIEQPATIDLPFIPSGQKVTVTWSSFADMGYVYKKNLILRLIPFNTYGRGEVTQTKIFTVTNYVGDYNNDLYIDGEDLRIFVDAWENGDLTREIAPTSGEIPDLQVIPDGRLDYEDLSVFAWMWNWQTLNPFGKPAVALKTAIPDGDFLSFITIVPDSDGNIRLMSDRSLSYVSIELASDRITSISGSDYWDGDGKGVALTRVLADGSGEFAAARLEPTTATSGIPVTIASISLDDRDNDNGNLTIRYKVRIHGEPEVISGASAYTREKAVEKPAATTLFQNSPNPFNGFTTITYALTEETKVKLTIYNVSGQQVKVLKDEYVSPGTYSALWDASGMPSGIYFYSFEAGNFIATKKLLLVK